MARFEITLKYYKDEGTWETSSIDTVVDTTLIGALTQFQILIARVYEKEMNARVLKEHFKGVTEDDDIPF